jgi:hypothetical protein
VARKPYTCAQCHKGPDVPAYKVYSVSKHGNIHSSLNKDWDFDAVPWMPGTDFSAPTCAACHSSLLATEDGEIIVERTHAFNDRTDWRLFGLPYAHRQPKSADTTSIVNAAGLPLPTELTGEPVEDFLIGEEEGQQRRERMKAVCLSCHSTGWVKGHFSKLDEVVEETNEFTLTGTQLLLEAWEKGVAQGPGDGGSPFDEDLEREWVRLWLFHANSVRFASAMGGADYGTFAGGRWDASKVIRLMRRVIDENSPEAVAVSAGKIE